MIPDLLTLERLAKAATPGTRRPYHYSSPRGARQSWCIGTDDSGLCGIAMNFKTKEDAEFHAACSPDVILALVARVRELEGALQEIETRRTPCEACGKPHEWRVGTWADPIDGHDYKAEK